MKNNRVSASQLNSGYHASGRSGGLPGGQITLSIQKVIYSLVILEMPLTEHFIRNTILTVGRDSLCSQNSIAFSWLGNFFELLAQSHKSRRCPTRFGSGVWDGF